MKTIPLTPDTEALARRMVWFEEPGEALCDTFRFIAYALAKGTGDSAVIYCGSPSPDNVVATLSY